MFGFIFETLVARDLRIYCSVIKLKLFHFRDNVSGLEIDNIIEFENGEYACVQIKLGFNLRVHEETLLSFQKMNNFIKNINEKNNLNRICQNLI